MKDYYELGLVDIQKDLNIEQSVATKVHRYLWDTNIGLTCSQALLHGIFLIDHK